MPYVFVYGALMSESIIRRSGVAARVNDHRVAFKVKGVPPWEPSFANLEPHPKSEAWGVVVELSALQWKELSNHELSYSDSHVTAITEGGASSAVCDSYSQYRRAPRGGESESALCASSARQRPLLWVSRSCDRAL